MFHADTWEQGYREALRNHGYGWSERDSQEVWHKTRTTPSTVTPQTRYDAESRDA